MVESRWPTLSIYDFLGYFVPGALALYLCVPFFWEANAFRQWLELSWETGVLFFLVAYVSGYFLSFGSAVCLETYAIDRYGYPSRYLLGQPLRSGSKGRRHVVSRTVIFPVVVLDWLLAAKLDIAPRMDRPCDRRISQIIQAKVCHLIGCAALEKIEFFHLVGHWVREHAPGHAAVLQVHVARKGFLRTLAFLAVLASWAGLVLALLYRQQIYLGLTGAAVPASYVAFLTYLKQERRFTLETLMAFAVCYDDSTPTSSRTVGSSGRLEEIMDEISCRAEARGLTPEILAEILEEKDGRSSGQRVPADALADYCRQHQIQKLSRFGSTLGSESGVHLLVVFEPEASIGFMALARIRRELGELFGRVVDLVPENGLKPASREQVAAEAEVLFKA